MLSSVNCIERLSRPVSQQGFDGDTSDEVFLKDIKMELASSFSFERAKIEEILARADQDKVEEIKQVKAQ